MLYLKKSIFYLPRVKSYNTRLMIFSLVGEFFIVCLFLCCWPKQMSSSKTGETRRVEMKCVNKKNTTVYNFSMLTDCCVVWFLCCNESKKSKLITWLLFSFLIFNIVSFNVCTYFLFHVSNLMKTGDIEGMGQKKRLGSTKCSLGKANGSVRLGEWAQHWVGGGFLRNGQETSRVVKSQR